MQVPRRYSRADEYPRESRSLGMTPLKTNQLVDVGCRGAEVVSDLSG
jgi:hypothetical protein